MTSFRSHLNSKLKNPSFREAYEDERELLELAVRIQEKRNKQNLSQAELANKAGITQQQLSRLETGSNYNVSTLLKVCHALGLKLTLKSSRSPAHA
tara:strand:+ start:180 stop:467 length:288 start_codon:yes stop_codon:yes gene_type:complete